jgi:filamentous hemagglutinin family protein
MSGMGVWGLWCLGIILGSAYAFSASFADAQISTDHTLSTNVSTSDGRNFNINNGNRVGGNLFHSFKEFSVPTNGSAVFNNAFDVQNIISRVTGGSVSSIDGLISTNGAANLFLINPSGIIFGSHASLNIGGSFLTSTAKGLIFANGFEFSTTAIQTPPLLTISVPLGLQFGTNTGNINILPGANLSVPSGKTLALVGGNVTMDNGKLQAPDSRVEIGGVAGTGIVGLEASGNNLGLKFPAGLPRSDVSLTNGADINVRAGGGGSITINARNINISGSFLEAGIDLGKGSLQSQAKDIVLDATGAVTVSNGSILSTNTYGQGKAGNINITTGLLDIQNSAALVASIRGFGNAGSINITANQFTLSSGAYLEGDLDITGEGRGADINLNVTGTINLIGDPNSLAVESTRITVGVLPGGKGSGGNLKIKTGSLMLTNGAIIKDSSQGFGGTAGDIMIHASDITISGSSLKSGLPSGLFTSTTGGGNAGNITIETGSFKISDGAALSARTQGGGRGGNIKVNASSLNVLNGGQLVTTTSGKGQAGNIVIDADQITISGTDPTYNERIRKINNILDQLLLANNITDTGSASGLFASTSGLGNGGNITINTSELLVQDGASVTASTSNAGAGGNLTINGINGPGSRADSVQLIGTAPSPSGGSSGLFAAADPGATGRGNHAGDVMINTRELLVQDGARVSAVTRDAASGGNLFINADSIKLIGIINPRSDSRYNAALSAASEPGATGNAGNLTINTRELSVQDEARVVVSSSQSQAGNLTINAKTIRLNQGSLTAETAITIPGQQAAITLNTGDLILRHNSRITSNATGSANAGDIIINTDNLVGLNNSDITANADSGQGGDIKINTQGLFGFVVRTRQELERLLNRPPTPQDVYNLPTSDITAFSQTSPTLNGQVNIDTPDIQPILKLVQLPNNLIETSKEIVVIKPPTQIVQACTPNSQPVGRQSSFAITGRGGLPASLKGIFSGEEAMVNLLDLPEHKNSDNTASQNDSTSSLPHVPKSSSHPVEIVEAQGWVRNSDGTVTLVAEAPNVTPHNPALTPASCQTSAQR